MHETGSSEMTSTVDDHKLMPSVETLTPIWERLLQRSEVDPQTSFYELGGTERLADQLFAEIARVCGREAPSATINYAQSMASLASVLAQPSLPRFSPFAKIKDGDTMPPIFIAHGLAGTVEFFKLARHIRTPNPVYGIQAKGIDGLGEPLDRVEDMAAYYFDAFEDVWPRGPYLLIGYSFGGLVALEMAQRLLAKGREVALMALVDTYPHPHFLARDQQIKLVVQRLIGHGREMWNLPWEGAVAYFKRGLRRRLHVSGCLDLDDPDPSAPPLSFSRTVPVVKEKAYHAYQRYKPRYYPGTIKFITTAVKSFFPTDPASVWYPLTGKLEIEVIPGDHLQVVRTQFEGLAAVLTRYVQQVTAAHR